MSQDLWTTIDRYVTDLLVEPVARPDPYYPKAKVNRQTEDVFGVWLVRVPRNGGGRITFSVPVDTKRIDRIGVPFIPFCE
jgi:hypothetical protein